MNALRTIIVLASALPLAAQAAEMRDIKVDHEDGYYTLESEVWFDAGHQAVYEVFSDWDIATEFSSAIVESRDTGPDENGEMDFYIRNRGCILFFCKSVVRAGSVSRTPLDVLEATADPEQSDFEVSDERWTFHPENGGTIVRYHLRMKPAFWIPPLIGPYMIQRKLGKKGDDALDRIEEIAREWAATDE